MTVADFGRLQDDLPGVLRRAMGIPVDWADLPNTMQSSDARARCRFTPVGAIGEDERVTTFVPDAKRGQEMRRDVFGNRRAILGVQVWSTSQKLGDNARFYLERLRTRLRFETTLASLRSLGLALIGVNDLIDLDGILDGRATSRASLDIELGYAVHETDEPVTFIERALVSTGLHAPDGTPLPDSLQLTDAVAGAPLPPPEVP